MVNKLRLKSFIFLFPILIIAQNEAPIVENVTFSQRNDGSYLVDIYYDVNDPEGSLMKISMKVSNNAGINWDFQCNKTSGDIGSGILSGTGKHIIWDFRAEHPDTCCDEFKIKIIADDRLDIGIPCPGIPAITDLRNGEVYETVLIREQCWLKRNLNIGTMIDAANDMSYGGGIEKYCYNNDEDSCNKYGGLYQWGEAMQYEQQFYPVQGICPDGWHIPMREEIQILYNVLNGDGNALKAVGQGQGDGAGTNITGFSALLAGNRTTAPYDNYFSRLSLDAFFWSFRPGIFSYLLYLSSYDGFIDRGEWADEALGFSVRCLKD